MSGQDGEVVGEKVGQVVVDGWKVVKRVAATGKRVYPPLGDDGDTVRRHHVEAVRLLHVEVVHERVERGLRRERDTLLGKSHLHEGELHFLFGIVIRIFNGRKASRRRRRGRKEGCNLRRCSLSHHVHGG